MPFKGSRLLANIVKGAKGLAKQTFTSALSTDFLLEQRAHLDLKKAELQSDFGALSACIGEALTETAAVIEKLNSNSSSINKVLNVITSSSNKHQGILFINYRGEIIFTNEIAQQILGTESCALIGKTVENFVIDDKPRKHIIEDYSIRIINYIKSHPHNVIIPENLLGCNMINSAFTSPVYALLSDCSTCNKGKTNPFTLEVILLDTRPNVIDDIIYVCRLYPYQE